MHTPKPSQDDSPPGENDELIPQYNPATANRPMMTEDEWLYIHSIVEDTIYNPVTMSFVEPDEE